MDNRDILRGFADNTTLVDEVKALIRAYFTDNSSSSTGITFDMNNEQIGAIMRARLEGLEKVEEAFKEIEQYKTTPVAPARVNRAR